MRAPEGFVLRTHVAELKRKFVTNDLDLMDSRAMHACLPKMFGWSKTCVASEGASCKRGRRAATDRRTATPRLQGRAIYSDTIERGLDLPTRLRINYSMR